MTKQTETTKTTKTETVDDLIAPRNSKRKFVTPTVVGNFKPVWLSYTNEEIAYKVAHKKRNNAKGALVALLEASLVGLSGEDVDVYLSELRSELVGYAPNGKVDSAEKVLFNRAVAAMFAGECNIAQSAARKAQTAEKTKASHAKTAKSKAAKETAHADKGAIDMDVPKAVHPVIELACHDVEFAAYLVRAMAAWVKGSKTLAVHQNKVAKAA